MAISMLKIRRPLGRLIFNMGIAIPGETVFLIETAPSVLTTWPWPIRQNGLAPAEQHHTLNARQMFILFLFVERELQQGRNLCNKQYIQLKFDDDYEKNQATFIPNKSFFHK